MTYLRPALILLIFLTLITGVFYPLLTTGLAQELFNHAANGSLLYREERRDGQHEDKPIGSALIGQQFTRNDYFWSRPSATPDQPYNALASAGSNLAMTNPALDKAITDRVLLLRNANAGAREAIPVDLVTSSASGLDPHISIEGARWQALRVAQQRGLSLTQISQLIDQYSVTPLPDFLGAPVVNVLQLNMALDEITTSPPQK